MRGLRHAVPTKSGKPESTRSAGFSPLQRTNGTDNLIVLDPIAGQKSIPGLSRLSLKSSRSPSNSL